MPVMALDQRPKSPACCRNIRPAPLISNTTVSPSFPPLKGLQTPLKAANANDWISIKSETGCFFLPDWSSVGAKPALELAGGVADGLFSWAAWPWGIQRMNTYIDASYLQYLRVAGGKPYMMPVSPWFYTNMPGYNKNWAWHSDDLWYDRWMEVDYIQPEWVEIISWNDYGESHYIGPLNDKAYVAFTTGRAPYNYVRDMPHDSWRLQLKFSYRDLLQLSTRVSDPVNANGTTLRGCSMRYGCQWAWLLEARWHFHKSLHAMVLEAMIMMALISQSR